MSYHSFPLNIGPQPCTKGVAWFTIFILSMDDLEPQISVIVLTQKV